MWSTHTRLSSVRNKIVDLKEEKVPLIVSATVGDETCPSHLAFSFHFPDTIDKGVARLSGSLITFQCGFFFYSLNKVHFASDNILVLRSFQSFLGGQRGTEACRAHLLSVKRKPVNVHFVRNFVFSDSHLRPFSLIFFPPSQGNDPRRLTTSHTPIYQHNSLNPCYLGFPG